MIFKKMKKRNLVLLVSLILVLCLTAGGTLAYLTAQTDSVVNTFTPASSSTTIVEEFNDPVKEYAKVTNTSQDNVTVYIRAQVVVTWKDNDGNVLGETPVPGVDYEVTYPDNTGWFNVGDYYYYSEKVVKDASTGNLLTNGRALKNKDGYNLSIEILAQSIQADPADAVVDAWPAVKVDSDGKLTAKQNQ